MTTLQEARDNLRAEIEAGNAPVCPCCEARVRLYRRNIYAGMAVIVAALNRMYEKDANLDWIHVREFPQLKRRGFNINSNYSFLRHWGLLEQHPDNTGYWRLTQLGRDFAAGRVTVRKYVLLLNGKKIGESGKQVSITEALGDKFDLNEIFNTAA